MNEGDVVRLKQPIRPGLNNSRFFLYGIVIKVIPAEPSAIATPANADVLVYLYDPRTREVYTDELGVQAVYSFRQEELELL